MALLVPRPTGVAATDSAALQAAHDALPAAGGRLILSAGNYALTAGSVTFTKPVTLVGQGKGDLTADAPTTITVTTSTGAGIIVSADGCTFEDFCIRNTSGTTPTAGAGIHVTTGYGFAMNRVKIVGFWNGLQCDKAMHYNLDACHIEDSVNWGAYLRNTTSPDFGDCLFSGCWFASNTTSRIANAAVRWESGGGLKMIGCKTNGNINTLGQSQYIGVDIAVADGVNTSVISLIGNSIEGIEASGGPDGSYGILIRQSGTGTGILNKVIISGNELAVGTGVGIVGTVADKIGNVIIEGNMMTNCALPIYLTNCHDVVVGVNRMIGIGGNKAVSVGTGCTGYTIAEQSVAEDNVALVHDLSMVTTTHGPWGGKPHVVRREIPSTTSSDTYTTLNVVQFSAYSAAIVEVQLAGQISGIGAFVVCLKRAVIQVEPGTVPGLTTIGTDLISANAPTVLLDAADPQTLRVKVRLPGSGADVFGTCALVVEGPYTQLWKGVDS